MYDKFIPTAADYVRFAPEILLTVFGTLIMLIEAGRKEDQRRPYGILSLIALAGAIYLAFPAYNNAGPAFQGMLIVDGFGTFFRVLCYVAAALAVLCSGQYLSREKADSGEYYSLILFSVVGQGVMVTANELLMVFIGLEISSIATYVLAGFLRDDQRNNESALKYFLLGSFATAFLLYGIAWIYGLTGSTDLSLIRAALGSANPPNVILTGTAAALMFVGLAFKVSAFPFQIWTPDVYQGAPAPVSAFMSAGPKAAAFAILVRIFMTAFEPIAARWEPILWVTALATMVVGNFAALAQVNIKRLLAYSSIAHAGYILVAITAQSQIGISAVMFYLAAYTFMNVGAFAAVTHLAGKDEKYVNIEDLAGLGQRQPVTAALLSVFLLSLIGVPLTGGFFGKFYIFKAALDSNLVWLTVLGLLNSAVAAYYYLRVLVVMYMQDASAEVPAPKPVSGGILVALVGSAVATVILGVFPSVILNFAGKSGTLNP
ncbi:MAG: NADH-quinone oxidoreductase subunit N [Bryobacteraceae bacterium]|nr:NADH-quinone oxidoreductase subunit N [Bryobacteraceae bacterium]